jgi:hypothetical protein
MFFLVGLSRSHQLSYSKFTTKGEAMSFSEESGSTGKDAVAFLLACGLGYLVGTLLPGGPWAVYTSILVAYHLFLAWLVITADHEVGFSLPIGSTIVTHLACMGCVIGILLTRHYIPFFRYLGLGVAGLAFFERGWLFVRTTPKEKPERVAAPVVTSTADDYQEWMRHLAQLKPSVMKPGTSMKAEYEKWLLARAQSQSAPSQD